LKGGVEMFLHVFGYNLKTILRTRESVFWSLVFSILLATLFYFAFGNLSSAERFQLIDIALVEGENIKEESQFLTVLSSVSDADGNTSEDDLFRVRTTTGDEADELLKNGKIAGYIFYENGIKLAVSGSGLSQTIIKSFLDQYRQNSSTISSIIKENPTALFKTVTAVMNRQDYLTASPASSSGADVTVNFFYALLAMACLMGSTSSVFEITKLQANLSSLAARVNVTPVKKFKMFLYNISAITLFQVAVILIVLAYLMFVLGINFGNRIGYVILTCIVGSITGVFFGTLTGVFGKSMGVKMAVTIGGTLFSSFLAGLMATEMKYFVQQNAPVVSYLSPANLIADAFYSLYYYESLSRFFINIGVLSLISVLFCTITCLVLRRRSYASL